MITCSPYRPSNGTEGDIFTAEWCGNCALHSQEDEPCDVMMRAMFHSLGEPGYPKEWIKINGEPRCTAFQTATPGIDDEPHYRCDLTSDMFEGPR